MAQYLNLEGLGTFLTNIKNNIKGWLGINASSGSSTKFLNEQGNFVEGTSNLLPYAYKKYVEASGNALLVSISKPGSSDPYSYKVFFDAYVSEGNMQSNHASIEITVNRENGRSWKIMWDRPNETVMSFSLKYDTSTNATYLVVTVLPAGQSCGCVLYLRSATSWNAEPASTIPSWLTLYKNPDTGGTSSLVNVTPSKNNSQVYKEDDLNTVGSASQPVYVDTDGQMKKCTATEAVGLKYTNRPENSDANSFGKLGLMTIDVTYINPQTADLNAVHLPITGYNIVETFFITVEGFGFQRTTAWGSNRTWMRTKVSGNWNSWKEL